MSTVERFQSLLSEWTEQKRVMAVLAFTPTPNGGRYQWGPPVVTEGAPGSAKTSFAYQFSRLFGWPCAVASPSMDGAGAFALVPVPSEDMSVLSYPAPDYALEVTEGGLVLVDEFTSAGEELMPPVHKLTCERKLGRHQLGPRCRVWGACNPADQGSNVQEVKPAMANRVGWLKWSAVSLEEAQTYMMDPLRIETQDEPLDSEEIERWVMDQWPSAYAEVSGLWSGFIQSRPDLKDKCPGEDDPNRSRAWPSMRTWVMAVHALTAARIFGLNKTEQSVVIRAFVGTEAWQAWDLWTAKADLPSVPDLLDGKVAFSFNPARLDRTIAVLHACVGYCTTESNVPFERVLRMWELFEDAGVGTRDFTWPLVKAMVDKKLHRVKGPDAKSTAALTKQAMSVVTALSPFRKASLEAA